VNYFLKLCFPSFFLFVILGCESKDPIQIQPREFSLNIVDPVQIDCFGDMMLLDYDSKAEKYLLANQVYNEYLEVDGQGKILNNNKFQNE
jgi:hypothetical protein